MGKKRVPLRQPIKGNAKALVTTSNSRSNSGKRSATALGSEPVKAPVLKKANKKQIAESLILPPGDDDDVEDDEWSKIERNANANDDEDEDDDSDDDDDDDNSDYSDEDSDNEIKLQGNMDHVAEDYTFEFNDMRDEYTAGVRTLLRSVLSNPTEAYDLAELITAQKIVGTVINCEGGEDAFAFASVLPLQKCVQVPTLSKLMDHLAACLNGMSAKTLTPELKTMKEITASCNSSTGGSATAAGQTGLLLHQRFSNLPIELIGPLHRNLEEDLSWAKQRNNIDGDGDSDDETAATSSSSNNKRGSSSSSSSSSGDKSTGDKHPHFFATLTHVLLLCPVGGASLKDYDLSGSHGHNVLGGSSLTFNSFEDEVYFQCASAALLVKPPKSCNAAYEEGVVAVLVPAEKVKSCVNGICALLPDTA